ncbi:putative heparinase superfamily protein [Sphingomonas vulcanisoli]|uniref:Heparinase superfamily protein n=1 Tax=Sphingomonas vulcanisoli TaxID=1658060 RepID=A0ABX0TQQ0_9SPHN|nr:heparinase II/III family protein [Sphingomonas vulcanisoli]NIJ06465.1 putative heparinase superfamily protein [Sphingomonas vulcanisoli]
MAEDDADTGERRRLSAIGAPGFSLADLFGRAMRRLSWRSPVHKMRLRGRYPLQLIDVPGDPVPGRPRAGKALLEGRMLLGQESVAVDAIAKGGFSPAFADHYQSFAWLRDLAVAAPRDHTAPVAEALTAHWLKDHGTAVAGPGFRPDLWGRRTLMWAAYAPLVLGSADQDYRKAVLNCLARGARHLDRAADAAAPGVARVAAWAGVITAGLLMPGGDIRVAHGEAGLIRALALALLDDGGVATRVPAQQLDLVELLVQLRAVYEVRARPLPAGIAKALAQALPALFGVVLGDGALSSWQGGNPGSAARIEAAAAASGLRIAALSAPKGWGYQQAVAANARLVIDAAPPPTGALVRGGCASTLAFELSEGGQRLIVNCGGAPGLPAELAEGLRTTAAHSTLVLADTNSTSVHADGSLGKGVGHVDVVRRENQGAVTIEAAHDGYVRRHGFRHSRRLTLNADGRQLSGEDALVPAGRKRAIAATRFAIHFHLAPGLDPVLTADGKGALLKPAAGEAWQFRSDAGALSLEDSLWIDAFGRPQPTRVLTIAGETPPDGASVGWSIRKVR